MLQYSESGYAVSRSFEGRSLKAYKDEAGVWTIGFGATNADAAVLGFEIKAGVTITETQAEQLLRISIPRLYEPAVRKAMAPGNPTQPAYDAGVDFDFNTGAIARASWVKSFVAHNLPVLHSQILAWNKAGGKALAGLTRRRNREWLMISAGDYGPEGKQTTITDEKGNPVTVTAAPDTSMPSWLARMDSILGLYEFAGAADNPAIIAMAQQCGGSIAKNYKHDATPWCALTVNWCLVTTGNRGDDSLLALDFRKGSQRLDGPAVGAIATMTRDGGGHVFLVRGRTADGRIVGVGGNQSNMVCDETFDPHVLMYGWPKGVALPGNVGIGTLPVVTPRPHTHVDFGALPGSHPAQQNGNPPAHLDGTPGMLRKGDKGPEVIEAKGLLIAAGYKLTADNDTFGPLTDAAVRDFQRKHPQLDETGIMDPATRAALARTSNAKGSLAAVAKSGTAGGAVTTGAHAASGGSLPMTVFVVLGVTVVIAAVLIAWKYRDELRAMLKR